MRNLKSNFSQNFIQKQSIQLYGVNSIDGLTFKTYANKLRLMTLEGRPYPPKDLPASKALRGEGIYGEELIIEHASGKQIIVWANAVPLYDKKGRINAGLVYLLI